MSQPPPLPERQPPLPDLPPQVQQSHTGRPPAGHDATPGSQQPLPPPPGGGDVQRVFDTVAGPNLRLRDNLIQLACVVIGTVAGALIGRALQDPDGHLPLGLIGALAGLVVSVLISGLVIGVVRFVSAGRQRRNG